MLHKKNQVKRKAKMENKSKGVNYRWCLRVLRRVVLRKFQASWLLRKAICDLDENRIQKL
jgi:hypothetical protein